MSDIVATNQTIVVVGGGISGITAALEAAEVGKQVILIEKRAFVGGRVAQLYKYFPKLCIPTCGLEINQQRLKTQHNNLTILTLSEVAAISGKAGDYNITVKISPRFINQKCTACGECAKVVEAEFDNEFNYNMDKRKGAYLPYNMAYPQQYVLDPNIIGTEDATKAQKACKFDAIDLEMNEKSIDLKAGAIIWATGWSPYDAAKIDPYGYQRYPNVITNVEFERMMDKFGPTKGKLVRPSDGKAAKNVAFIQCAGSRDENHLRHCSRICCMSSLKESTYVSEQYGDEGKSSIYYIDIRAIDRFDDFYQKVKADKNTSFIKSKVAHITENSKNNNPILNGVDIEGSHHYSTEHDLVVLATGMQPNVDAAIMGNVRINEEGFIEADEANSGIFAAGCAADAVDVNRAVQSGTASALRAIQVINRSA